MRAFVPSPADRTSSVMLRWRIVTALLVVSLIPLALVGAGAWVVFGRLLEDKSLELQRAVVSSHAASIEDFLATRRELLEVLARTHRRGELVDPERLKATFEALSSSSGASFLDLGVIGADGSHLAYLGPYDLASRNYRDTEWFREVMAAGVFTSDVFLGFRNVPHFVIAVRMEGDEGPWVLRATVDSAKFDAVVSSGTLGPSSEAFLVNRQGLYQTTPRNGSVLDPAPRLSLDPHPGLEDQRVVVNGVEKLQATAWIDGGRWLLVVRQDLAEVRAPVRRAIGTGALVSSLAVLLLIVTTFLATRILQVQIDRANRQREEMFNAFMRSAKLASVGELATGLAHEINNPLAIISAEQTNLSDLVDLAEVTGPYRDEMVESTSRIRAQVERCGGITRKMLQFGRTHESSTEPVELAPRLQEITALMGRQASVRNVVLEVEVEPELPRVGADPLELEQVLVNVITNSFQAMPGGGTIAISARRLGGEVWLEVRDTGEGMPPEVRERIFEPFFTTKPAGQGTGLGLSVCFGLVSAWGGTMEVESTPGEGTTMRLRLQPCAT